MISIILPAYNEEGHIYANTKEIAKEVGKVVKNYEILIVEESSDSTPELAEKLARENRRIRHFHFGERMGKGKAIEYGIRQARGDKIIFMDIDLATGLSSLRQMIDNLEKYDLVLGSRYHPQSRINRTPFRIFLGRSYSFVLRVLFHYPIRDYQCGFKGFKKSVGIKVISYTRSYNTFWDTEFLFIAKKLGFTTKEIPVVWEEKKGRSTKISMKLIFGFFASLTKLFFRSMLGKIF